MNTLLVSFASIFAATGTIEDIFTPLIKLIDSILPYVITAIGAIGSLWCVILGVKLAKAEEQQEREKAKSALKNAIIGFALIFILMATLKLALPALTKWMNEVIK